ncbi:MAG: Crp/Fnr family transcriptional regulator [Chitinophagales bacterium]|nr:Crp/Fnr family transcriptional regulator [Chitinophagales bacterium]
MKQLENIFSRFPQALIQEIKEKATIKTLATNSMLLKSGAYLKSAMLVIDGVIKVYRTDENGNEFFVYFVQSGEACVVSMICSLENYQSNIAAKVDETATIAFIPLSEMSNWMNEYPVWYEFVIQSYRKRFDELLTVIDHIAFKSMDERLSFYLKKYANQHQQNEINLSHQEIANDLNTSREVVSRLLKKMEQNEQVALYRNQIVLLPKLIAD